MRKVGRAGSDWTGLDTSPLLWSLPQIFSRLSFSFTLTTSILSELTIFQLYYFLLSVIETPRTEVYCRPLPANSSLHHELYHHFSSFPECRQKEMLPALLLKTTSSHSTTDWTDPIDINCLGTQVGSVHPSSILYSLFFILYLFFNIL